MTDLSKLTPYLAMPAGAAVLITVDDATGPALVRRTQLLASSALAAGGGTGAAPTLTSAAIAAALGYAPYSSGNPAGYQTGAQVTAAVQAVVGAAPAALSTLQQLAAQMAADEGGAAALTTVVSGKLARAANLSDLANPAAARASLGLAVVAASGLWSDLSGTPAPYILPAATTAVLGGVRPDGTTITVSAAGVISAAPTITPVTRVAASGSAQVLSAPVSGSVAYDVTLTANCALTLAGGTVGQVQTVTAYLRQDATAGRVVTLPPGVKWPGGTTPTPNTAASSIDIFTFTTPDAGVTWFGGY